MRDFSNVPLPRRAEKPVPIEVSEDAVPEHLKRFICVERFEPRVTIRRTSPRELTHESVESLISHLCSTRGINVRPVKPEEKSTIPGDGLLWPNPLLQHFREAVKDIDNCRLRELWKASSSHGISWDALDKLYMAFRDARDASVEEWEKYAPEIVEFASNVAREKIMRWREDCQTCPPRLLRKWTHLLYSRWKERYLHVYSPRMLSRYLKAEVTDRVLIREVNECSGQDDGVSELPFDTEPSEYNPHFVRRTIRHS